MRQVHESNVDAGTCTSRLGDDPTPAGENVNPPYYGVAGVTIKDACDADSSESRFGATGLDSDGDGGVLRRAGHVQ